MPEKRKYVRKPKRITRRGAKFTPLQFVRAAGSSITVSQAAVQRIGNAIIGGDFTGNARGQNALDIQVQRDNPTEVASGARSIAFGRASTAAGDDSAAIGTSTTATNGNDVAMGTGASAAGGDAVALGSGLIVSGAGGVGLGAQVTVGAANALAVGFGAVASAARAVALGFSAQATSTDKAVIAGTSLWLQTDDSPLTQVEVFSAASYTTLDARYVNVSGDTMTGKLIVNAATQEGLRIQSSAGGATSMYFFPPSGQTISNMVFFGNDDTTLTNYSALSFVTNYPSSSTLLIQSAYKGSGSPLPVLFGFTNDGTGTVTNVLGLSATFSATVTVSAYATDKASFAFVAIASQTANLTEWLNSSLQTQMAVAANGRDWIFDTSTGSKLGTATNQKIGVWGATPVAQQGGYTQTYSTADKTHANLTSATLTDNTSGTANTTLQAIADPADAPASTDALRDDLVANALPAIRNNFADLAASNNALIADLTDVKQLMNAVIDDLQTIGWLA